jgi:nucleotide-binding universal stress UspA family protein
MSQIRRIRGMSAQAIVVGYDGGDHANDALELGRMLARLGGSRLVVACAYPDDPFGETPTAVAIAEGMRADAEEALGRARERLGPGEDADCRAIAGPSPSKTLHALAEEAGAELIVVGATHHGTALRLLAGSTPEHVLDHAPCPVAVAPEGYAHQHPGGPRQIGVAYDGSPESERALQLGAELARRGGARLRLVTVVGPGVAAYPPLDPGAYAQLAQIAREEARERLDAALAQLAGVRAEGVVREGEPVEELARDAAGDDLLIAGSRGRGPVRRVLLGSISSRLLRTAACPVVVVPRG